MAVGSGIPFNVHTGTGSATVFAYSFTLLDAGDLAVTVAGVPTTAYTVAGIGSAGGGAITFSTAPASGAPVILRRVIALVRETDYQNNGDLLAPTLNGDFDRLWMAVQGVGDSAGRAVRAPFPEVLAELPPAAERAGRVLGFDGMGRPLATIPADGSAAQVVLDLASTSAGKGADLVGFKQPGATPRTAAEKLRERISVSDYANLAFTHTAKDPGDPNSHVSTSFTSWRLAIQAAIDEAFARGGGTVVIDAGSATLSHQTLLVDDSIYVRSNVRVEFEAEIKLGDYTTIGGLLLLFGDNIEVVNPRIDGSGIFAGASGENGICPFGGDNIKVYGGEVRNFARGNVYPNFGGKGVQAEGADSANVLFDGTTIRGCFMGVSILMDFSEASTIGPLRFSNMFFEDCQIVLFTRQASGFDVTGDKHSVILENFSAKNCGSFDGAIQLSRASNVLVADGLIVTSASINSFIRGNHRFCEFRGLTFSGPCDQVINLDPSAYAVDSSYAIENNRYEFKHTGVAGYVANASIGTPFRTMQDCRMQFQLQNDVATKIVGDELRNGYCRISGQQGAKSFDASAADLFTLGLAKFANLPSGHSLYAANAGAYSFNAPASPISFADASGGGVTFSANSGDWTKIGRMVFVSVNLTFNATASGAANLISGLPFPAINNARGTVGFALRATDLTQSNVSISVNSASSAFQIVGSGAALVNSALSGKTISGIISYMTS